MSCRGPLSSGRCASCGKVPGFSKRIWLCSKITIVFLFELLVALLFKLFGARILAGVESVLTLISRF